MVSYTGGMKNWKNKGPLIKIWKKWTNGCKRTALQESWGLLDCSSGGFMGEGCLWMSFEVPFILIGKRGNEKGRGDPPLFYVCFYPSRCLSNWILRAKKQKKSEHFQKSTFDGKKKRKLWRVFKSTAFKILVKIFKKFSKDEKTVFEKPLKKSNKK